ncbi:MAG: hypothetical protein WAK60_12320 [Sedimentisphaerales bacterium]
MNWFKITTPPTEGDEPTELLNMFIQLFIAAGEPKNTALLSSETLPNTYYVCTTEHSVNWLQLLIESYGASACHKPSGEKLTPMAGKAEHIDKML